MLIGVISDTHIPDAVDDLPSKIYEVFSNVDLIIHAGDIMDLGTLEKLNKISRVEAVCGNMDHLEVKNFLPQKKIITAGNFRIGIFHGRGAPAGLIDVLKKEFEDEKVDCIIFGHSHNPLSEVHDGVLFFNPGSATDKIFAPYNSCGILEINDTIKGKIIKL